MCKKWHYVKNSTYIYQVRILSMSLIDKRSYFSRRRSWVDGQSNFVVESLGLTYLKEGVETTIYESHWSPYS